MEKNFVVKTTLPSCAVLVFGIFLFASPAGAACGSENCVGTDACKDQTNIGASCPTGADSFCEIVCNGGSSCSGSAQFTSASESGHILCTGTDACKDATINLQAGADTSQWKITCDGGTTCSGLNFGGVGTCSGASCPTCPSSGSSPKVYNYDGITSPSATFTAEDGEIDQADGTISNGTFSARRDTIGGWANFGEASTAEYANLVGSDDSRYQTADPNAGDNAVIIFELYLDENASDITEITVSAEIGRRSSQDFGWVYLWNYTTGSYRIIGDDTGSADAVISDTIDTDAAQYIHPTTSQVTVFVVNEDVSDWIRVDDISVTVDGPCVGNSDSCCGLPDGTACGAAPCVGTAENIEFDLSSIQSGCDATDNADLTIPITVASGDARLLVAYAACEGPAGGCALSSATATFGGQAMTEATSEAVITGSSAAGIIWYLVAPPTGTDDLVLHIGPSVQEIHGGGLVLHNVDQVDPIQATATQQIPAPSASFSNSITTTTANALLLDIAVSGSQATDFTANGGQTKRINNENCSSSGSVLSTKEIATAGSGNTMGWSNTTANRIAHMIVAITPVIGADTTGDCECVLQDTCSSDVCVDNGNEADGTTCGSASDTECSNADSCLAGSCDVNDETLGFACGDTGAECLVDDTCNGSGACTDNGFASDVTSCTGASQGGDCDNDPGDVCSGSADTCVDAFQLSSFVCRAGPGQCEVDEQCTGSIGS